MICSTCGTDKPDDCFELRKDSGTRRKSCKACRKEYRRGRYLADKDRVLEQSRRWYEANRDRKAKTAKANYVRNRDEFKRRSAAWREANRGRYLEAMRKYAERYRLSEYYAFVEEVRKPLRQCLRGKDSDLLPYSAQQLRDRLERMFAPGMTWANHGEWEVDHIKPYAAFFAEGEKDPAVIHSLSNLQPIWRSANRKKSSHHQEQHISQTVKLKDLNNG